MQILKIMILGNFWFIIVFAVLLNYTNIYSTLPPCAPINGVPCTCNEGTWEEKTEWFSFHCTPSEPEKQMYYQYYVNYTCNEYYICTFQWFYDFCNGWEIENYFNLVVKHLLYNGPLSHTNTTIQLRLRACSYEVSYFSTHGYTTQVNGCVNSYCCKTSYDFSTEPPIVTLDPVQSCPNV